MRELLLAVACVMVSCAGGSDGQPGKPGKDGKDGVDAVTSIITCKLTWEHPTIAPDAKGDHLNYNVLSFQSGDRIASLHRTYYNNSFRHNQSVTALYASDSPELEKAFAGDSTFMAELVGPDKAIFKKLFNGVAKEVSCVKK